MSRRFTADYKQTSFLTIALLLLFSINLAWAREAQHKSRSNSDIDPKAVQILSNAFNGSSSETKDSIEQMLKAYQDSLRHVAGLVPLSDEPRWVNKAIDYCQKTVKLEGMSNICGQVLYRRQRLVALTKESTVREAEALLKQRHELQEKYPDIVAPDDGGK